MKKLFRSRVTKEKAVRFFDREGFYIVLFICVCIVAVTAVWVSRGGIKNNPNVNLGNIKDNKTTVETPAPPVKEASTNPGESKAPAPQETKITKTETQGISKSPKTVPVAAAPKQSSAAYVFNIASPVNSALADDAITRDYSPDELVCYQFINAWRTHAGLDVKAYEGTEVMSVGDGKVVDVRDDNESGGGLGWTVVVDHNNGYRSVYSNLDENLSVQKNQSVKKGQKLGLVGKSSIIEKEIPEESSVEAEGITHLHFELLKKSTSNTYVNVDPKEYFSANDNLASDN